MTDAIDSLDAAWAAIQALLEPSRGHRVSLLTRYDGRYLAILADSCGPEAKVVAEGDGITPTAALYSLRAALAPPPDVSTDSLDAAWAAAEATLPEGWSINNLGMANPPNWQAWATAMRGEVGAWVSKKDDAWLAGTGPTPVAALRALAAKLGRQEAK